MPLDRFGIALYRGTGCIAAAIRWQTWGPYSHAALLLPDNTVIEAAAFQGVRRRAALDIHLADVFDVRGCTSDQWIDAYDFAARQIGKPYDFLGVLRFISRRANSSRDSWFCSELVFAALWNAGMHLLDRVHPSRVDPTRLSQSPRLKLIHAGAPHTPPPPALRYRTKNDKQ